MTPQQALALVAAHRVGVLVTLRRDGRAQTSNVAYAVVGQEVRVSLTEDRAKTRNLRRDPRAHLHVSTPDLASWAAVEGTAVLSPVSTVPGDETGQGLAELYRLIGGQEHPDWDEFFSAMVDERRVLLRFTVDHGYGGGAG